MSQREEIKIIRQYGYEYTLVRVDRLHEIKREAGKVIGYINLEQPSFLGYNGFALRSCKKINIEL